MVTLRCRGTGLRCRVLWFAIVAGTLGACATPPERVHLTAVVPDGFRHAAVVPDATTVPPDGAWWRAFGDSVLDGLIEQAERNNTTIHAAAARLAQARAALRGLTASRMPLLSTGFSSIRQEGPLTNAAGTQGPLQVGSVNLSYEIDLFGRLENAGKAAVQDITEREALLRGARLLVAADLAQTYFHLRAVEAEREIVAAVAASQSDTVQVSEGLLRAGLIAVPDAQARRAEALATAGEVDLLDRRRAELEHAIAILAGAPASSFSVPPSRANAALPRPAPGVPGIMLVRRPDVAAARQALLAAQSRVGLAQDAWLPVISLTGLTALVSPNPAGLASFSAVALAAGLTTTVSLLDGGRRAAQVAQADSALQAAEAQYAERVLAAIKDVEDQLVALRQLAAQAATSQATTEAAVRTAALVEANRRSGLASALDSHDFRRRALRSRQQEIQVRGARLQATVGLIKALGGGWEMDGARPLANRATAGPNSSL